MDQQSPLAERPLQSVLPIVDFAYRRRDKEEKAALRAEFHWGGRQSFLKALVHRQGDDLRRAGFTEQSLACLARGRAPRGFQVHHIRPLDDGGTNDYANLVLIRAHPEHEAIHRYLDPQIQNLVVGETRMVRLPQPAAGICPSPSPEAQPKPLALALAARHLRQR